jgi:hypothetical protein
VGSSASAINRNKEIATVLLTRGIRSVRGICDRGKVILLIGAVYAEVVVRLDFRRHREKLFCLPKLARLWSRPPPCAKLPATLRSRPRSGISIQMIGGRTGGRNAWLQTFALHADRRSRITAGNVFRCNSAINSRLHFAGTSQIYEANFQCSCVQSDHSLDCVPMRNVTQTYHKTMG